MHIKSPAIEPFFSCSPIVSNFTKNFSFADIFQWILEKNEDQLFCKTFPNGYCVYNIHFESYLTLKILKVLRLLFYQKINSIFSKLSFTNHSFQSSCLFVHYMSVFHWQISNHCNFLGIFEVWSMLHHESFRWIQSKEIYAMFTCTILLQFFVLLFLVFLFFITKCLFLSFSFLFLMKYRMPQT